MDADVTFQNSLTIADIEKIPPLKIEEVTGIEPLKIGRIAPAAIHVKELNNIDPITLEPLRVNEVKNIDPISIPEFNVTRLPTVNLSVRQLPAVDMNIRRLPPVSVGFHQDIHIPSDYQLRARFFGVEFFRMNMTGHTALIPKEKARREQTRTHEKSYPEVATAGNPAIPSKHTEHTSIVVSSCPPHPLPHERPGQSYHSTVQAKDLHAARSTPSLPPDSISFGAAHVSIPLSMRSGTSSGTISSGE